jgi:hypothetical protein
MGERLVNRKLTPAGDDAQAIAEPVNSGAEGA